MMYLFDLDGTIVDSQEGITKGLTYALKKMEMPPLPYEKLLEFIGPSFVESFPRMLGTNEEETKRMISCYREYYGSQGKKEFTPYEGIIPMIKELHSMGAEIYMATAKPEIFAKFMAHEMGIDNCFREIVGALPGSRHEKVDVIREVLRDKTYDVNDVYMIGDRRSDVDAGKAFGLRTVGVKYGFALKGEIESAKPDYICDTVKDLSHLLKELIK